MQATNGQTGRKAGQGEWFAGSLLHWHVISDETGGAFALGEALVRPGGEPRYMSTPARTRRSTCSKAKSRSSADTSESTHAPVTP